MTREIVFRIAIVVVLVVTFGTRVRLDWRQMRTHGQTLMREDSRTLFASPVADMCWKTVFCIGILQMVGVNIFPMNCEEKTDLIIRVTGIAIMICAGVLSLWPRFSRRLTWGLGAQDPRTIPGHELVTHGAYRYIRHPFYSALVFGLVGVELALSSWMILLVVPLFYAAMRRSAIEEEMHLSEMYPYSYPEYRKRTGMFLPRF